VVLAGTKYHLPSVTACVPCRFAMTLMAFFDDPRILSTEGETMESTDSEMGGKPLWPQEPTDCNPQTEPQHLKEMTLKPHAPPCNPGESDTSMASLCEAAAGEKTAADSRRRSVNAAMSQERRQSLRIKKLIGLGLIDRYICLEVGQ